MTDIKTDLITSQNTDIKDEERVKRVLKMAMGHCVLDFTQRNPVLMRLDMEQYEFLLKYISNNKDA